MSTSILPRHIAIIMDGNGRWAKQRQLPRTAGHKAGVESVRRVVKSCAEKKIEILTLWAFSSENWRRPAAEVSFLMELIITTLKFEAKKLHKQNIQIRFIGDRLQFSERLQKQIAKAEELTADNTGLKFVIAVNYGGKWDLCQAFKQIAVDIEAGQLSSAEVSPDLIASKLSLADLPDPDLFIRTSGEIRLSNFMMWQLAYTELYFTNVLWPDFDALELENALTFFANRERRFGYISEQIRESTHA